MFANATAERYYLSTGFANSIVPFTKDIVPFQKAF